MAEQDGKQNEHYVVRDAKIQDCSGIIDLIQELADYEKMPSGPTLTAKKLEEDLFCENPVAHCLVAETLDGNTLISYALYNYTYSTWNGLAIHLEDIYVQPQWRNKGIGKKLFKRLSEIATEKKCCRLDFVVLEWNRSSIDFYEKLGAVNLTNSENWNLFRINKPEIDRLCNLNN